MGISTSYEIRTHLNVILEDRPAEMPVTVEVYYNPDTEKPEDAYLVEAIYYGHPGLLRLQERQIATAMPEAMFDEVMGAGEFMAFIRREVLRARAQREAFSRSVAA